MVNSKPNRINNSNHACVAFTRGNTGNEFEGRGAIERGSEFREVYHFNQPDGIVGYSEAFNQWRAPNINDAPQQPLEPFGGAAQPIPVGVGGPMPPPQLTRFPSEASYVPERLSGPSLAGF